MSCERTPSDILLSVDLEDLIASAASDQEGNDPHDAHYNVHNPVGGYSEAPCMHGQSSTNQCMDGTPPGDGSV